MVEIWEIILISNIYYIFDVFSACGGIRTGSKLPVLTAYFPVLTLKKLSIINQNHIHIGQVR